MHGTIKLKMYVRLFAMQFFLTKQWVKIVFLWVLLRKNVYWLRRPIRLGPVVVKENVLQRILNVYECMSFEARNVCLCILTRSNVIFHSVSSALLLCCTECPLLCPSECMLLLEIRMNAGLLCNKGTALRLTVKGTTHVRHYVQQDPSAYKQILRLITVHFLGVWIVFYSNICQT